MDEIQLEIVLQEAQMGSSEVFERAHEALGPCDRFQHDPVDTPAPATEASSPAAL